MKTLHITNAYHPTSGGIRHFYDVLLREAGRTNRLIRLVVPSEESSVEDLSDSARIYRVRAPRSAVFDTRYRVLLPPHFLLPRSAIARILRDEQPDLVEVCDKYALCYLAGALRKKWIQGVERPVLVGLSCERMDDNVASYLRLGTIGQKLAALYIRQIYVPQFDCHIANSEYTASELRDQAPHHRRDVRVLPMGVETDRFTPSRRTRAKRRRLLERIGATPGSRVLVYAGRLASEKNVGLLPAVLEGLSSEYRLVIAGGGPLADALSSECAARTPKRTTFLPHLDRDELADVLANADLFIHPNPREPFGIGPLEAMASGLPLVAPTTGGITTYANDETAWLAPAEPHRFAERVRDVFADATLRTRKTARALEIAHGYRWERVARQFFDTYEQLVSPVMKPHRANE